MSHHFSPYLSLRWMIVPTALLALPALINWLNQSDVVWFLAWNHAAQGLLPAALWAGMTNMASTLGMLALIAPTLAWYPRWAATVVLAAPAAILYTQGLKHLCNISRPAATLPVDAFYIIGKPLRKNSFPSGHTATAFVVAGAIIFCLRKSDARWLPAFILALATLLAFSRVAVGAHWPSDLFAGAAGGWLGAALGAYGSERWRFWEQKNAIRLMAGGLMLCSIALFFSKLGYPEGQWVQYLLGCIGVAGSAYAWHTAGRHNARSAHF